MQPWNLKMTPTKPGKQPARGRSKKMFPAIAQLGISLDIMKTNEPINRREGDIAQADLEKENAKSFRAAISLLKKA